MNEQDCEEGVRTAKKTESLIYKPQLKTGKETYLSIKHQLGRQVIFSAQQNLYSFFDDVGCTKSIYQII